MSSGVRDNSADHVVPPPWHGASLFFAVVCKSEGLICCFLEVDTVLINDVWLLHWSLG